MRTLIPLRGSKPVTLPADRNIYLYRADIQRAFTSAYPGQPLLKGPVALEVTFWFRRPDNHYMPETKTRGHREVLRTAAPDYMAKSPDLDKLVRAICDALTGFAYHDDAQVSEVVAKKYWGGEDVTDVNVEEER
jgi:Holliday junction resolvase RusA-like endonuclease